jgi:hypothetical protein
MAQLTHPYGDLSGGEWVRGNLHTHSLQSDGARAPQDVIDDYAARGYDFLEMSDHDIFTSEEKYREWDSKGLILIPGNEISRGGPHLHHVDADRFIEPFSSRQEVFNAINAATRETGRGFAIVNHPNWGNSFEHATISQMREWTGYVGLEIYNGVIGRLHGSPYATNKWDILLSEGRRLWGFANDDSHQARDVALGWNVVYVKERTAAAIVEALRNGRFYASTGVVISSIAVNGDTIRIETENARRIVALCDTGRRFSTADDSFIEVQVPDSASYIRFECWGDGESFAWTQPFFVEKHDATAKDAVPDFLQNWQVSAVLEEGTLAEASPDLAAVQSATPITSLPANHRAAGFVDVQRIIRGTDGIIYLSTEYESNRDGTRVLKLGFDGPVRVWVNGQQVYYGPGSNPAVHDAVAVFADFREGINNIVIALHTNKGRACGVFARVQ